MFLKVQFPRDGNVHLLQSQGFWRGLGGVCGGESVKTFKTPASKEIVWIRMWSFWDKLPRIIDFGSNLPAQ